MRNKTLLGLAAAVVVLSIATVSAKAQSLSIREDIVNQAVDRIVNLIMGESDQSLGATMPQEQTKSSTVMVSKGPIASKNSNRSDLGVVDRQYKVNSFIYGTIPSSSGNSDSTTATTTDYFLNNTGKTLYADMFSLTMYTSGTASSVMDVIFATSPTPFYWNSTPAPELYKFKFATSTQPGLLSGGVITARDSETGGGTSVATTTIPILDGEYFGVLKKQPYENGCTGATCESATSTNWGVTGNWELPIHYFTTSF